jgi:gamma-polyglutamate biosynthesis protein CapA
MKQSSAHTASHLKSQQKSNIPKSHLVLTIAVILLLATTNTNKKEVVQIPNSKPVTITFVGDVMFDRGVRRSIEKNFANNYGALFTHTSYIKQSDIAFANLEGPVAPETVGRNVGSVFSFRMNPKGLVAMKAAGFDVVSFANNHVGDYSRDAFVETLHSLNTQNIKYAGAGMNKTEALTPSIFSVNGIKIAFLAATDVGPVWMRAGNTPGVVILDDPEFLNAVKIANTQVDILIVSVHWGIEYSPANKRQEKWAHTLVDNGADIIVGHHPHVMQRIEVYKEKPIFYSLGNFIFDQYFSKDTLQGMVATVSIDSQSKAISYEAFISPINRHYLPQPLIPFTTNKLIARQFIP